MDNIRILIVDDHKMFATAIASQLEKEEGIIVIDSITDPEFLMARIEKCKPDAILMDVRIGKYNGLDIAEKIKHKKKNVKIILMSGYFMNHFAISSGADAFISKEENITSLTQTIRKVCIDHVNVFPMCEDKILTKTETKILYLISQDMTRKQVAAELYVSEKTVTNHITSILNKLQVRSRIGAIMKGIELGLINRR